MRQETLYFEFDYRNSKLHLTGGGLMIDNKQKKQLASAVRVKGLPKGCYQVRLSI